MKSNEIREYVASKLKEDSSPEQIAGRIGIEQRPSEVETRARFSDWEADTLISRSSRLVQLERLEAKTSILTSQAIISRLLCFPRDSRHTITFDNGTENAGHEVISKATDIKCFFCEPYSSWQRGTNEHTNGLVRQHAPWGNSCPIGYNTCQRRPTSL